MDADGEFDLDTIIDAGRVSGFQFLTMVLCALVAMMDGFDTQSIAFVAPELANAWHIEPAIFGPVFGAGLFGGMLGAMAFGPAGDRFGRKATLILAVALFATGSLVTPLAGSVTQLGVIRFGTGLGLGGALPIVISLTSEYAPKRLRSTLVALMFCGFPLGAVIGAVLSAKLIPSFGWKSVFIAGGGFPLVLLPLFVVFVPESARFLALQGKQSAIAVILKRMGATAAWNGRASATDFLTRTPLSSLFAGGRALGTVLLWGTFFLSLLLSYFLLNWIPVVARQAGHDIQAAVLAVAMLNLGAIGGCVVLGRLADRFGQAPVIGTGYLLGAFAIALIGQVGESAALLLVISFVTGFLSIGAQMCTVALCASFYETRLRATGVGWTMGIGRIGAIIGPVLGGLLIAAGIAAPAFFLIAGLTSLGAATGVFAIGWFVLRDDTPGMLRHGAQRKRAMIPHI